MYWEQEVVGWVSPFRWQYMAAAHDCVSTCLGHKKALLGTRKAIFALVDLETALSPYKVSISYIQDPYFS